MIILTKNAVSCGFIFFETIAKALAVNVKVLTNPDFDGIKAMHRLFQVFRQYDEHLFEYQDQDGNDMVTVSFGMLSLMRSWSDRYEEYMKEVEKCNSIKDVKKRRIMLWMRLG